LADDRRSGTIKNEGNHRRKKLWLADDRRSGTIDFLHTFMVQEVRKVKPIKTRQIVWGAPQVALALSHDTLPSWRIAYP
jgi:hypothetical protein